MRDSGLGYFTEEISKQSVKDAAWSSLLPVVQCEKKRKKERIQERNHDAKKIWWKCVLSLIQIAKDTKIKSFSVRKRHSGEKTKGDSLQPFPTFLEETKCHSIHSQRRLSEVMGH